MAVKVWNNQGLQRLSWDPNRLETTDLESTIGTVVKFQLTGLSSPGTVADTAKPPKANGSGACVFWRASARGPSVAELTATNSLKVVPSAT